MKHVRVVAALIPDPKDPKRFLVQQRPANKARANLWEFPGGKVEPGESDSAALVRECKEELDVDLEVGRRLWGTTHAYEDSTVTLELFETRITKGAPKPHDCQALSYCSPDEMRALPFCEADVPLLAVLETLL